MKIIRKIPATFVPNGFWYEEESDFTPALIEQFGEPPRSLTLADGYHDYGDPSMAQWIGEDGYAEDYYSVTLKGEDPDEEELNEMRVLEIKFMMGEQ